MQTSDIIKQYGAQSLESLALQLSSQHHPQAAYILQQVEGWQRLRMKVPSWAAIEGLQYPPRLALEQCSGEAAAQYKLQMVKQLFPDGGNEMVDLTGGLGVDFSFMARNFKWATYVEQQEELCRLARHNFPLLKLQHAHVICGDGEDYLRQMDRRVDLIFLDPARRDSAGKKTVLIEDCRPDVCVLCSLLLEKAHYVVVKLSPMLDIAESVRSLGCVEQVCVFATGGECKDLLLVLSQKAKDDGREPLIYVSENGISLSFRLSEERCAEVSYATQMDNYLFEPGPALLKAGAFRWVAARYGLKKLHPNSHLYTSEREVEDFPGRSFRVKQVYGFGKQDLKNLRSEVTRANLTVRNFPASVDVLRKKLKIKDGGEEFIFVTTMADNQHVLVRCEKARRKK